MTRIARRCESSPKQKQTLPAVCIEKVMVRKSGEELYSKTYQSLTVPGRFVLKPNLHYGRQDTTTSVTRTSFDPSSKHKESCGGGAYNESCRGEIDIRIQGLPHSAVQEQDHIRKEAVQKLIHQFETHPNKEALQADPKQNRAFNPFSEQSKEMIYSTGNMVYFGISEITPKLQCHSLLFEFYQALGYVVLGSVCEEHIDDLSHSVTNKSRMQLFQDAARIGRAVKEGTAELGLTLSCK